MKAPGGNSIISDGGISAAGTAMQEKFGDQRFSGPHVLRYAKGRHGTELP